MNVEHQSKSVRPGLGKQGLDDVRRLPPPPHSVASGSGLRDDGDEMVGGESGASPVSPAYPPAWRRRASARAVPV